VPGDSFFYRGSDDRYEGWRAGREASGKQWIHLVPRRRRQLCAPPFPRALADWAVATGFVLVDAPPEVDRLHYFGAINFTRVENGKLVSVKLEPIEPSGALTVAIREFK